MLYKKIRLDENDESVYLEAYVADKVEGFVRDAILVIPGGGYHTVCSNREGEPIGMAFMPKGYNAFVLHYSVQKKPFPCQLIEASKAIKHIRDNAENYNINPDRVFTVGFSAGGHLAASLGTLWHMDEIYSEIDMPYGYNKPNGMMLIYPVISYKYHPDSLNNLFLKESLTEEEANMCSIENRVDEKSSPAFILHTANDEIVDIRNALAIAESLAENNISFELHVFPDAPHGVALGNAITMCGVEKYNNPRIAAWIDLACEWAKTV